MEQRRAEVAEAATEPGEPAAVTGSHRGRFDRALRRLEAEAWDVVGADDALVEDVAIAWRGGFTSRIQSVFAREGLVVSVPGQGEDEDDDLLDLDADELRRRSDVAMDALFGAVHGTNEPDDGVVTCLATDGSSDLCRIVRAFGRLAGHGYIAEPDLWADPVGRLAAGLRADRGGRSPKAVFWTTQRHTECFDARGDLTDELALQ
ncbi:hypothetical protein AB0L13_27390 [Saccharopolyspora shandongensis]|uniref:hypothetical protein n=1 Tax=Saccharopolyspora shandongensis TaxID=418495 RepID=UPI00343B915F